MGPPEMSGPAQIARSRLTQSGSSDPRASDAVATPPEDEALLPVILNRVKDLDVKPADARTRLRPINDGKQRVARDAAVQVLGVSAGLGDREVKLNIVGGHLGGSLDSE